MLTETVDEPDPTAVASHFTCGLMRYTCRYVSCATVSLYIASISPGTERYCQGQRFIVHGVSCLISSWSMLPSASMRCRSL